MYDETALLDALANVIKKHANYSDTNVTIGDQRVLDRGIVTGAVVDGGPINSPTDHEYNYMAGVTSEYSVTVYVYRKYVQDAESRADLRDDTKNVRETIDGYHRLSGNAESCKVTGASAPIYIGLKGRGPSFIVRELTVSIFKIEEMELLE